MKKPLLNFLVFCFWLFATFLNAAEDQWQGVDRIVAIGDVHGDYDNFVDVLKNAGIINRRRNWTAEDTHFVQVGDIPDRGPDTDKIIELMQKLERQAVRDGGMVHSMLGNHEVMNVLGDLRYVHPGEYEALKTSMARRLRDRLYARELKLRAEADPEFEEDELFREQWYQEIPLGFVEHRLAWNPEGEFGAWVAEHNSVIKINRILFMHGGISPEVLGKSIREINEQIRSELKGNSVEQSRLSDIEAGPLWYRGMARNDESTEQAHVDAVLDFYDVDHIVLGHTPSLSTVIPRFGGKVLLIDTGISEYYGSHLVSLLIEDDELSTIQRGEIFRVPMGDEPVLPYFKAVAEVEPQSQALRQLISNLESPPPPTPQPDPPQ